MDTYQFKYLLLECLRDDKFRKAVEGLLNGEEPTLDWVDMYGSCRRELPTKQKH